MLVRIATSIRDAYSQGSGSVDVDMYVSPAALLNTAGLVEEGTSIKEAIEVTFLADVAWDKAHRESVRGMIEMHLRDKARSGLKAARGPRK